MDCRIAYGEGRSPGEAAHHNAVFVGRDESGIPRYAHQRDTAGNFRLDVKGSDKALLRFLSDRPDIQTVYLCLDSDQAGNDACSRLVGLMPED